MLEIQLIQPNVPYVLIVSVIVCSTYENKLDTSNPLF